MTTWMLVEDEADLYALILAMYEMLGIGGVAFVSGEEAFDWIVDVERGQFEGELPELALIDIRLPDEIDGMDVARRLKESPVLHNIAVVMMTAYRMTPEEERQTLAYTGAVTLLYKPLPAFRDLEHILREAAAGLYNW